MAAFGEDQDEFTILTFADSQGEGSNEVAEVETKPGTRKRGQNGGGPNKRARRTRANSATRRTGPPAYDAAGVSAFQALFATLIVELVRNAALLNIPETSELFIANYNGIVATMAVVGMLHHVTKKATKRVWQAPVYNPGAEIVASPTGGVSAQYVRHNGCGEPSIMGLLNCGEFGCCIGSTLHHAMSCAARLFASFDLIFDCVLYPRRMVANKDRNRSWCIGDPATTFSAFELATLPHALRAHVNPDGIKGCFTTGVEVPVFICASGCFIAHHFGGSDLRNDGSQMMDHIRGEHGLPGAAAPAPTGLMIGAPNTEDDTPTAAATAAAPVAAPFAARATVNAETVEAAIAAAYAEMLTPALEVDPHMGVTALMGDGMEFDHGNLGIGIFDNGPGWNEHTTENSGFDVDLDDLFDYKVDPDMPTGV